MERVAQPGPAQCHEDHTGSSLPHQGEQQTKGENRHGNTKKKHLKIRFLVSPTLPFSVRPPKRGNPYTNSAKISVTFEQTKQF